MTTTTAQRRPRPIDLSADKAPAPAAPTGAAAALMPALRVIASLKLTVVLFALGLFLIFAGTFALKEFGLWTAMDRYFRCWLAWIDIAIFFPAKWAVPSIKFPYPGGWTIGFAMLFNLLAAHWLRWGVKAAGTRLLWGVVAMVVSVAMLSVGLYLTVVSQPGVTQSWWQASGRVEGVAAMVLGSAGVLWSSLVVFEKRAGIFLTHAGVILLLLGELVTGLAAVESQMVVVQGDTSSFTRDIRRPELAFITAGTQGQDEVVAIPASMLREGATLDDARLPFVVKVEKYYINSKPVSIFPSEEAAQDARKGLMRAAELMDADKADAPPVVTESQRELAVALIKQEPLTGEQRKALKDYFENVQLDFDSKEWRSQGRSWVLWHAHGGYEGRGWMRDLLQTETNLATTPRGKQWELRALPESPGTSSTPDMPAAYVTLTTRKGDAVGTYMLYSGEEDVFGEHRAQAAGDGQKNWRVALRFERLYKDYTITVKEVRADKFTGSDIPRNYSTQLVRRDKDRPQGEEVIIRMNEPMRFSGETFYQSGINSVQRADDSGKPRKLPVTILQVVSNPGYLMPYIACIVVSVGLMLHFGVKLTGYVRRNV